MKRHRVTSICFLNSYSELFRSVCWRARVSYSCRYCMLSIPHDSLLSLLRVQVHNSAPATQCLWIESSLRMPWTSLSRVDQLPVGPSQRGLRAHQQGPLVSQACNLTWASRCGSHSHDTVRACSS